MESLEKSIHACEEKMDIDNPPPPAQQDVISTLPEDVLRHGIGSFLNPREKAPLRVTSRFFNNHFNGEGLLQAVVYGDLKTVKSILTRDPKGKLLLGRYWATDYAGRRIHQTAYQAALAAEDEEMAAVIQEKLLRCHGPDTVQKQQQALFPEGEEKIWEERQRNDRQALDTIIEAIAQANVTIATVNDRKTLRMDETCKQAMADFRKHLDAYKDSPITTGRHWNAALLLRAFELYIAKFNQFGGEPTNPKNLLVWRQVIGTIQRYAPANYAQVFALGFVLITKLHYKRPERTLAFMSGGDSYFPLDSNPESRLGYHYAFAKEAMSSDHAWMLKYTPVFLLFLSDKNSKIAELMQHPSQRSSRICAMM